MKALALALALLAGPAAAADLQLNKAPPAAVASVYSWTGFYLSGYADYGVNFTNLTQTMGTATFDLGAAPHGPGVGGALSALYQLPASAWVLGVRAELGWANLRGSGALATPGITALSASNATNYLGSLNGVLGLALGADQKLLGYLTGGFAFGGVKTSAQLMANAAGISDTSVGYDLGLGLAYALTPNISIFIEGDYFHLGGKQVNLTDPVTGATVLTSAAAFDIAVQKAGLSFRF